MTWAIAIALTGAFCLALGSALQERDAIRAPGASVARLGFLLHLARRPRWLLGSLAAATGVCLHLVALSAAPLTIVQPLGVTGLLFAIVLSALFNRQRIRLGQLLAGAAVMVGLVGLLTLFPHSADPPVLPVPVALALTGGVAAVGTAGYLVAHWIPAGPRAVLLAVFGGAALGTTSALTRVVAVGAATDLTAVFSWLTLLAVAIAVFGGLLQQNAYRTGHFAAAYATLLVVDPVVGAGIGVLVLGEAVPTTPLAQLLAAGAVLLAVAGTTVLARAENRNPEVARHFPTPSVTDLVHTTPGDPR
ncbi:DMT family transporter [Thermobifida halotolerans]|uniref:DMT family transporter n=1 Tax=Thermobifida halotolerans TaxID=483545 RepID=A0A399G3I9_9ACTN|nr:DMT family transporter [Thermobifida halotolerans]UOE17982.1 DMT family transporter [Thermobifida halotolerans]